METKILKNVVVVGGAAVVATGAMSSDAEAQGFDGFYGGLSYGNHGGESDGFGLYSATGELSGGAVGAFVGWNRQIDPQWVVGAELSYSGGTELPADPYAASLSNMVDLRARVGYTFDDIMIYGTVGYSMATKSEAGFYIGSNEFDLSGFNVGIGAEWNVSDTTFVGADVTRRSLSDSNGFTGDVESDTMSVRFGMRF